MKKMIIKWLIFACVIMATCYLPGVKVENFAFAMLVAAILTFINVCIKPVIKLVTFPINLFTFGLFGIILNFAILYGVSVIVPQYSFESIPGLFLASIIIAVSYCILKKI